MPKRLVAMLAALLAAGAAAVTVETGSAGASPVAVPAPGGSFVALTPARILDTRSGLGAPAGATQQVTLDTAGVAGIPTSGVSAVAVNLTVTGPTAAGFLTAYPAGTTRPVGSNSNYTAGQTVAAMTLVPVSSVGQFSIYASARTQIIADVSGYFTTAQTASTSGLYNPLTPARLMNTRTQLGGSALGPGSTTTLQVTGAGGMPETGVAAVVVNLTAVAPTAAGNVTAYPAGIATPVVSSVNFARGETRANRAIVPVGQDGKIALHNATGTTQFVVDVSGYFTAGNTAGGSYYVAQAPSRVLDTRTLDGSWWRTAGATTSLGVTVDGGGYSRTAQYAPSIDSVAPTTAVWLTVTAVKPTASGYLTAFASKTARPATSDLNAAAGRITPNAAAVPVGSDGDVNVYSSAAEDLLVDLDGYFAKAPTVPTSDGLWTWGVSGYDPAFHVNSMPGLKAVVDGQVDFALDATGHLRGWNRPTFSTDHLSGSRLNLADGGGGVKQLVGSPGTTYVLSNSGHVGAWGGNEYGEIGDGTHSTPGANLYVTWSLSPPYTVSVSPSGQPQISDVTLIGAASHNGYAVKSDGTVWAWGQGGHLGNGSTSDSYVPVQVTGLTGAVSIAGGDALTYAVDSDGHLWRWGNVPSSAGFTQILTPQQVTTACTKGTSVAADAYGAWELCDDGSVWQLYRDRQSTDTTVHLTGPGAITAIAAAPSPGVQALNADGTVWRLPSITATQFEQVYGLNGITAIGGGTHTAYALK